MTSIVVSVFAALFLSAVVYGRLKFRHATLATVVPLPGERVLLEDEQARFAELPFHAAVVNALVFVRAVVRVTDRRLLIAQPALFAPQQRMIRFAVFTSPIPTELGSALVDGYLSFATTRDRLTVGEHKGRRVLKLVPSEPGPPTPQYLLIESPRLEEYLDALGLQLPDATSHPN
jgi:hypothetical protein